MLRPGVEEHAREKELVSMRVLPHATALTHKDVGESNMHGLSERPFDKGGGIRKMWQGWRSAAQ